MLEFFVRLKVLLSSGWSSAAAMVSGLEPSSRSLRRQEGQTTAEYALVILAAAAVAIVLIAWARSSGKLPAFFDKIIDEISQVPP
jgi:Flp pilus assembly pilin Flp